MKAACQKRRKVLIHEVRNRADKNAFFNGSRVNNAEDFIFVIYSSY